jgi:hypothetical protein
VELLFQNLHGSANHWGRSACKMEMGCTREEMLYKSIWFYLWVKMLNLEFNQGIHKSTRFPQTRSGLEQVLKLPFSAFQALLNYVKTTPMGKAEDLAGFDLLNKTFTSISHFEQEF